MFHSFPKTSFSTESLPQGHRHHIAAGNVNTNQLTALEEKNKRSDSHSIVIFCT